MVPSGEGAAMRVRGRSSGGGDARRTVTAGSLPVVGTCAATAPLTQPPLPDSGGPQKRWGMVSSTGPTYPRTGRARYLDIKISEDEGGADG